MTPRVRIWGYLATGLFVFLALGVTVLGLLKQVNVLIVVGVLMSAAPLLLLVLARRPQIYLALTGVVLGFMPFAALPGTGFQLAVLLSVIPAVIALTHPAAGRNRLGVVGVLAIVYLVASALSAVATYTVVQSIVEYVKWALATATVLWALLIRDDLRLVLMRAYAVAAAVGAIFTSAMLMIDKSGAWVENLRFLGYGGSDAVNERAIEVAGSEVVRAAGLYVDPNSAGLFFLFAIGIGFTVYRGLARVAIVSVLAAGVVLTLSRAAITSLIVAFVVYLMISRMKALQRLTLSMIGIVAFVVVASVPAVSSRLIDSFSGSDVGADARIDALQRYPQQMAGSWWFGRGWYLREFYDPFYGVQVNHAANTPLIVVYRAGLIAGIVFVILLIAAIAVGVAAARRGVIGVDAAVAVVVGLVAIAFQLDFPVVTMPALSMAFFLLLAQVQALARSDMASEGTLRAEHVVPAESLRPLVAQGGFR